MTEQPLDHIRRAGLPWRTSDGLTECGRPVSDVVSVVDRERVAAKIKSLGQKRASYSTCMTCADTSNRWRTGSFVEDPISVLRRECDRVGYDTVGEKGQQFRRELLALAALVEAHRPEFDEMVSGLGDVSDLSDARAKHHHPRQFGMRS